MLKENCFLTDDHIAVLAKMYADLCGRTCHLIIETQQSMDGEILRACWFEFVGSTGFFEITLRNRWNSHWEPVIRVLDVNDVSKDGSPLDQSSTAVAKNKHQSNAIKVAVAADESADVTDEVNLATNEVKFVPDGVNINDEASISGEASVGDGARFNEETGVNGKASVAADEANIAAEEANVSDPRLASFVDHMGNEVKKTTKLVPLIIPKKGSSEWHNVETAPPHSCQLVTSPVIQFDKGNMPTSKDLAPHLDEGILYNHRSANLLIRIGSLELNPWLEIQMVIYRSTGKVLLDVLHKSSLRFFFGRLLLPSASDSTDTYATMDGISNLRSEISENHDKYLLSFEYQYAVPHNLHIVDSTYKEMTEPEKSLACLHQNLAKPSKRQPVSFIVHRSIAEITQGPDSAFDILLQKLAKKEFAGLTSLPYEPYLTHSGFVNIQANSFKNRMQILKDGSPHMPVKARVEFADLIEAGVQVGFYTDL